MNGAAQTEYLLPDPVWQALSRWGMILEQDKLLPSVASIIAGGPLNSSWWGNPAARGTCEALQALDEREDVVSVKLVSGRVTFVLKRLWPALLGVAQAREDWQLDGLSKDGLALLNLVDAVESVRLDRVPGESKALRESARLLERRLLVHGTELHTETGAHTKVLESWSFWSVGHWPDRYVLPLSDARATLEATVTELNAQFGSTSLLPWQAARATR
jgi:hypothetical protein